MRIFDLLIDMIGYAVARLVLPTVSFGKIYVEPLTSPLKRFNVLGCRLDERGRIEIESTVAGFIGFCIFLLILLACSLLLVRATPEHFQFLSM